MTLKPLRIAIATVALAALATPAPAGELGLDDLTNAKLARIKAKQRQQEAAQRRSGDKGSDSAVTECGSIGIGNTVTNRRGAPKEVTVIVTGDVINANNRCR